MMRSLQRFVTPIVVLVLIGAAAGTAVAKGSAATHHGASPRRAESSSNSLPTLRWDGLAGTATWAQTLDPAEVTDTISSNILFMIQAGLAKALPDGKAVPDLATWTVSKDRKVYTFTIRHGARFSNGDPVTAQDAMYSIDRALAKSTNSPTSLQNFSYILGAPQYNAGKTNHLAGVRLLSSSKLQITLSKPVAFFIGAVANTNNFEVLDKRVVAGKKPQTFLTDTCAGNVGAGPFMVQCLNKASDIHSFYPSGRTPQMTLVPNPYFYGKKPHIRVVMNAIADTQTNYSDFLANGIDATGIPTPDIAKNQGKPGFIKYRTLVIWYISPTMDAAPFNNVHCSRAVAYAINEPVITNDVLHHAYIPIYDVVPKGVLGYYNGANNPHYDPAKARAELKQCPGGLHHVTLAYQHTSSDWDNVYGRAIPAMLSAVGITAKAEPLSFNDWLKVVTQPQKKTGTDLAQNGLSAFPDPWNYCTILLRGGEPFNSGDYNNPTYNHLVDQADVTANKAERAKLYIEAQHIAMSQGGFIPMGQQIGFGLVKPWVHGFVGGESFDQLVPKNNDWSQISISAH